MRPEGSNPCAYIRPNKRRKCERFLSNREIARLGQALDRKTQTQPLHAAIIYLLFLTCCRLSEIVELTWSEVKGGKLLLHDSKTGPRTVWLDWERGKKRPGGPALRLLSIIQRKGLEAVA